MNPLFTAALELAQFLTKQQWRFCFIGGLAVIRWGEPRMTQDVDLALLTGFGSEKKFIHDLLQSFKPRVEKPAEFAIRNRVLLLSASNDVGIDLSLAGLPFEEQMIERSTEHEFAPGCLIRTCSAEDLIVLKAFAARDKDWMDIKGIVLGHKPRLDRAYIFRELTPLVELKEQPEILNKLEGIFDNTPTEVT